MKCPLCQQANECAMDTGNKVQDCWCFQPSFPAILLDSVPIELKHKACICQKCLNKAKNDQHEEAASGH